MCSDNVKRWEACDLRGRATLGPKNKYLVHVPTGAAVDVFSTPAENWGMLYFVRTGSADFIRKAMQRFIKLGKRGHAYGGVTLKDGTEEKVFELLELPWNEPAEREVIIP